MREVLQIEVYEVLKGEGRGRCSEAPYWVYRAEKERSCYKRRYYEVGRNHKEIGGICKRRNSKGRKIYKRGYSEIRAVRKRGNPKIRKKVEKVGNDISDLKKEQRINLYWILGVYITLWPTNIAGIITLFLRIKS